MRLYLIRHAEAVKLGEEGADTDEARPLTAAGRAQCGPVAASLRRLGVSLDRLVTSPLVRARQTAEGILAAWGDAPPPVLSESSALAPGGKKRKLTDEVNALDARNVGLVGHNPDLSELAGWLLGDRFAGINLEKAGLACVEFDGKAAKARGTLLWLVTPEWCRHAAGKHHDRGRRPKE